MKRVVVALFVVAGLAGANPALAQEAQTGEGKIVVTIIPAGATFFTESKDLNSPSFGNYDLGGAVAVNFNRYVGLEGEVTGSLGVTQDLSALLVDVRTPHMLSYSGNVVVSAPVRTTVVPYVTGGVGGLNVFEKASLGIDENEMFLTGNIGGGIKWYSGRWGLRGDYRFIAVQSKDDAPEFFGRETRYGHRFYGGVLVNVGR
jgi:outer membrane protein with beta-barrel domain